MTDVTTAAAAASNKASEKAIKAVAAASETLPTVVETVEVAMNVPSKVVLNQRLVVIASIAGGAALGAGVLYGINRFRNRNKTFVEVPNSPAEDEVSTNV